MSLLTRIQRYASSLFPEPEPEPSPCVHCADLRRELARQVKIKEDYWNVIERLEKQRNDWADMYNKACSGHLNAQTLYEAALGEARSRLGKAISWLNEYREKAGEHSPIVPPPDHVDPKGAPVGERERYAAFLRDLDAKAAPLFDAQAERAAVAAKHWDKSACNCVPVSSRTCERGTNCCTVRHGELGST